MIGPAWPGVTVPSLAAREGVTGPSLFSPAALPRPLAAPLTPRGLKVHPLPAGALPLPPRVLGDLSSLGRGSGPALVTAL